MYYNNIVRYSKGDYNLSRVLFGKWRNFFWDWGLTEKITHSFTYPINRNWENSIITLEFRGYALETGLNEQVSYKVYI